jgi:hypothetical protein
MSEAEARDSGGPAFPQNFLMHDNEVISSGNLTPSGFQGLSLRDYFAAQAICGLLGIRPDGDGDFTSHASAAYALADALLAARK